MWKLTKTEIEIVGVTAGKALYTLYQAVRCQTEKGAVDAITGEARYSLNDARLLRENIEPKPLVIAHHQPASSLWQGMTVFIRAITITDLEKIYL